MRVAAACLGDHMTGLSPAKDAFLEVGSASAVDDKRASGI
ncbi:hypothetical protein XOC_4433 [Xanthomonas oryzae pv. oryzicola BLS256]|uniref:Uncharacterized protein n=1 Tax=Xanthomonas oryzae pv. oryzicola (strain BLS256) TaxID=383407 RepID=G7TAA9_XANOB|nr:hypothetical protein XOC_4433 [Xanthomonas oryzae pv. oryzicola BLS256]QEO95288.1 hypothetical protein XOCgx_0293 [Xanthomonas oryzae pv. oryzicola]